MAWTMGRVKARVRSLVDDPQSTYITDDFVNPLIQEVYSDVNSQLTSTQSSFDIDVIEVPGIQPGTPNLVPQQSVGGILEGLMSLPLRIDWKPAGNDPSDYQLVTNYGVLPDVQPQQGMGGWEYRKGIIWLTRCSIAVDLRIRGEFAFAPLNSDSSVLNSSPRVGYVVAYGVAALIAVIRGNAPWVQAYELAFNEGMDEIMGQLVRAEQGQVRRVGRQTQRGVGNGFVGTGTATQ